MDKKELEYFDRLIWMKESLYNGPIRISELTQSEEEALVVEQALSSEYGKYFRIGLLYIKDHKVTHGMYVAKRAPIPNGFNVRLTGHDIPFY